MLKILWISLCLMTVTVFFVYKENPKAITHPSTLLKIGLTFMLTLSVGYAMEILLPDKPRHTQKNLTKN